MSTPQTLHFALSVRSAYVLKLTLSIVFTDILWNELRYHNYEAGQALTHTHTGGENSRLKSECCHVFRDVCVLRDARANLTRTHQFRLS